VITRQQDIGHLPAPVLRRSRVLGFLEQSRAEALALGGRWIADRAGKKAHNALDDRCGGDLTSKQDEVAERDLLVDEVLHDPLIDAFVPPAHQRDLGHGGESVERRLIQWGT